MNARQRRVTSVRLAGRRWRGAVRQALLIGAAAIGVAACGTSGTSSTAPSTQPTTPPTQSTVQSTAQPPTQSTAVMSARESGDVTIHTFVGRSLSNATYAIESPSAVVVIDTQYTSGDPEAFRAAVDAIGKPIAKVLLTHDHPDHIGGLKSEFADVPVASTAGVADRLNGKATLGQGRTAEVLPERFEIDGVEYVVTEYLDAEAAAQMVITLPDHDVIFTGDLIFNRTHLYLTRHLDRWVSILDDLAANSPIQVYPGHGEPAGPELYGATIDYIRTAQANLASSTTDDVYVDSMIAAYPDWKQPSLIGYFPRDLLGKP